MAYRRFAGRRHRYVWGVGQLRRGFLDSPVKQDLETAKAAVWAEKDGFPGEPVFVPAPNAGAEDEGVLLSVVLDGEGALRGPFAPHGIPFGFHGNYFPNAASKITSETSDTAPLSHQADLAIETVFKAQRETAIVLRTSTAKTRIGKLQRLEAAVLANREAIFRALAADLHRSEAETELLEMLR